MNLDTLIQERRSIRKYLPDMPPAEWIDAMLACAAAAPSPSNIQPVRFLNILSEMKKQRLFKAITKARDDLMYQIEAGKLPTGKVRAGKMKNLIRVYYRFSIFMFDAPLMFAVGTVETVSGFSKKMMDAGLLSKNFRGTSDLDISVGLALKGFILKGRELGLGTCILTGPLTFVPDAGCRLGIEDVRLACFVTVGFPDETPGHIRRKAISEIYREI